MYKTIIMPVDVFEMALSDKAVRHAEFLAQQDGVIHLLHVLPDSASFTMSRFTADLRGLRNICSMRRRLACRRWSATSALTRLVSSYMSVLAACAIWSTSWPAKLTPTW